MFPINVENEALARVLEINFIFEYILYIRSPIVIRMDGIAVSGYSFERLLSLEGAFENGFGLREKRPGFENLIPTVTD